MNETNTLMEEMETRADDIRVTARSDAKLTRSQGYTMLKQFVYPPCKKPPSRIVRDDTLVNDLGFAGNSRRLLAGKTNAVFSLKTPHKFSGEEMMRLETVGAHNDSTLKKIQAMGRLDV